MKSPLQQRGLKAEKLVADYLVAQGYTLCARNFTIRAGEVDIIAQKNKVISFVEVKMRTTHHFPTSLVVDRKKQRKIIAAARRYLVLHHNHPEQVIRFDVALVHYNDDTDQQSMTFIPNAFTADEDL